MIESYDWLIHDHSEFESFLYEFSDAVEQEVWAQANDLFKRLVAGLKAHMAMEEEVLYPAYESNQNLPQEPVMALRDEHDNIVRLVLDLAQVIKNRDSEHTLQSVLPLEQALISHHEKEEDIFLPMAGRFFCCRRKMIFYASCRHSMSARRIGSGIYSVTRRLRPPSIQCYRQHH